MKSTDYQKLIDNDFFRAYNGAINWFWSVGERPHNLTDINDLFCKDLEPNQIDINNVIILFPTRTGCGETLLFNNREIVSDYCTFFLKMRKKLDKLGIRFRNGDRLTNGKYSQMGFAQLIIKDGIASVNQNSANPFNSPYNDNECIDDIHINDEEFENLNIKDMDIILSGFFLKVLGL